MAAARRTLTTDGRPLRLGVVRYINARPLVHALADRADVIQLPAVPSQLLDELLTDHVDVALLPAVDVLRSPVALRVVSRSMIGADFSSLTVALFSHRPPSELRVIAADPDSHTSVALLRILCRRVWRCEPQIMALPADPAEWNQLPACLLIGDKVVTHTPGEFAHRTDLATAWRQWTGLPFVFALWAGKARRRDLQWSRIGMLLDDARQAGEHSVPELVARYADAFGWPPALVNAYFKSHLRYQLTPRHKAGLARFLREVRQLPAAELGAGQRAAQRDLAYI